MRHERGLRLPRISALRASVTLAMLVGASWMSVAQAKAPEETSVSNAGVHGARERGLPRAGEASVGTAQIRSLLARELTPRRVGIGPLLEARRRHV